MNGKPSTSAANSPAGAPGEANGASAERSTGGMVDLVDHCTAALAIAEARGDRFLMYMLSMTLQAARNHLPRA